MKLLNKHPVLGVFAFFAVIAFSIYGFKSVTSYFNRFQLEGFEETLTKNSALLAEMEVNEIEFVTNNYSGNASGQQALSLTVYVQSSLNDNQAYLSGNSIKLDGIKAVLDNDNWKVYGTSNTKEFKKEEIKALFETRLASFIEAKKKVYDNQKAWTESTSKNKKF